MEHTLERRPEILCCLAAAAGVGRSTLLRPPDVRPPESESFCPALMRPISPVGKALRAGVASRTLAKTFRATCGSREAVVLSQIDASLHQLPTEQSSWLIPEYLTEEGR